VKSTYTGVSWHKHNRNWRACLKYKDTHLHLGNHEDEDVAAWCVDFARYMLHGLRVGVWHHKTGRPNGPPRLREDFPRAIILQKIADANLLSTDVLASRLHEFDNVVKQGVSCTV
jgi:hypothetical protein